MRTATVSVGWDGSVGTATRYGLHGPGIESRWGAILPHTPIPALGPTQPPVQCVPGLFQGVKAVGASRRHPPHLTQSLKKEYSYAPISLPVLRWIFTFITASNTEYKAILAEAYRGLAGTHIPYDFRIRWLRPFDSWRRAVWYFWINVSMKSDDLLF